MVALRPRFDGPDELVPLALIGLAKLWAAEDVVTRPLNRPEAEALAKEGEPVMAEYALASCVLRLPSSSSESDSSESGTILESAIRPKSNKHEK